MKTPHVFGHFFDYFVGVMLFRQKSNVFIMHYSEIKGFFRSKSVSSVLAAGLEVENLVLYIAEVSLTWGSRIFVWDFSYLE